MLVSLLVSQTQSNAIQLNAFSLMHCVSSFHYIVVSVCKCGVADSSRSLDMVLVLCSLLCSSGRSDIAVLVLFLQYSTVVATGQSCCCEVIALQPGEKTRKILCGAPCSHAERMQAFQ